MKQSWWIKAAKKAKEKQRLQLNMSASAASRKLLRKIIFSLLTELDRVSCFRCGQPLDEGNFSIEHKEPWLDVSTTLFWDKNNIAFSHRQCNSAARRSPNRRNGSKRNANRERFAEWYSVPENREQWNAKRRERYALKKVSVGP